MHHLLGEVVVLVLHNMRLLTTVVLSLSQKLHHIMVPP
jgi:hypothetical protein